MYVHLLCFGPDEYVFLNLMDGQVHEDIFRTWYIAIIACGIFIFRMHVQRSEFI